MKQLQVSKIDEMGFDDENAFQSNSMLPDFSNTHLQCLNYLLSSKEIADNGLTKILIVAYHKTMLCIYNKGACVLL